MCISRAAVLARRGQRLVRRSLVVRALPAQHLLLKHAGCCVFDRLGLPVMLPANVLSWCYMRSTVLDVGQSYLQRIQVRCEGGLGCRRRSRAVMCATCGVDRRVTPPRSSSSSSRAARSCSRRCVCVGGGGAM